MYPDQKTMPLEKVVDLMLKTLKEQKACGSLKESINLGKIALNKIINYND
tara:strand:- start:223 stop:372 length:150 start_codon:yes stop_codon:yes gene_type:complete